MTARGAWNRILGCAVLALVALLASSGVASAHSGVESYVYLQIYDTTIEGGVHYPVDDLNDVLGLSLDDEAASFEDDVVDALPAIRDYTRDNLTFFGDDGAWDLSLGDHRTLDERTGGYVIVNFVVEEVLDPMPRTFDVEYGGIVTDKPERSALLLIDTDWRSGTFRNDNEHLLVYDADSTRQTVDLGETSLSRAVLATMALGAEHIQIGFDHILFIIALVLPAVLVVRREDGPDGGPQWAPTPTFGSGLWRVVKIATSFTVAHTITLTLGGLGVIELPGSFVEPVIALSIGLAALHNIKPVFFNKEWALAFAFGLFHGFGFAGLLAGLGLDRSNRVVSLLGFNVGIELGQIVVILLVFPSLFLLRRTRHYVRLMVAGSVALIAIALGWFLERVLEVDLGVTWVVDRILLWPRPLWVAAILGVVATGYWALERSRGRLLPLEGDADADDDRPLVGTG